MKRTNSYYLKAIEKIEDGKAYKSFKYLCNDIGIDYDSHKSGRPKRRLVDLIEKYYNIEKNGWEITLSKLDEDIISDNVIEMKTKELISEKFNMASRLFQANLIEYLTNRANDEYSRPLPSYSMYGLLMELSMISNKHKDIDKEVRYKNGVLNDVRDDISKVYYDKYYSDVVSLYERGLENLQKIKTLKFYKGHNLSYDIIKRKRVLKDIYKDIPRDVINEIISNGKEESKYYDFIEIDRKYIYNEFSNIDEESAIYNGRYDAWLMLKDIFGLKNNISKDGSWNINFFQLMSEQTSSYYKYNEKVNTDKFKPEYKNLLEMFYNNKEYSLYKLFRDITKNEAAKYLAKLIKTGYTKYSMGENDTIKVNSYYKAYKIIFIESMLKKYHKEIIKNILTEGEPKVLNRTYMIDRMFKATKDLNVLDCNEKLLEEIVSVCTYVVDEKRANNNSETMAYYKNKYLNSDN